MAGLQANSQTEESLLRLINKYPINRHDSIYYELVKLHHDSNIPTAKHYAQLSLQAASKYGHVFWQAKAYRALAYVYNKNNEPDSARVYFRIGIKISSLNNFADLLINLYNDMGLLQERLDVYDSALHYFTLSYNLARENKSYQYQAIACSNLGLVYSYLKNYSEALAHFKQAIQLANSNGVTKGFNLNLNLINVARVFNEQGLYSEALGQLDMVRTNCKNGCDDNILTGLNYGLGFANLKKGNMKESYAFFSKALTLARKSNNKKWLANTLYNLSLIAVEYKHYAGATKYLEEAEKISVQISHRRLLRDVYAQLSMLYEKAGAVDKAMRSEKLYAQLKDSIFNKNVANNITSIQLNEQHKQAALAIQKKDVAINQKSEALWQSYGMLVLLAISFILASVIIYFTYQSLRFSRRYKNVMELKLIKLLDKDQANQKELFRKETEFNYLLGRVTGFLMEPVNSLIGLSKMLTKNYTPEEAAEYATKIHQVCTGKISGVFNAIMELSGVRNLGVFTGVFDLKNTAELVHNEFKSNGHFTLLNFTIDKSACHLLHTDQQHLVILIKNAIGYFIHREDSMPIEVNFEQSCTTTIITIKSHATPAKEIPHENLFKLFSAQIIALKLRGNTLLVERDGCALFKIQIPNNYTGNVTQPTNEVLVVQQ